MRKNSIAATILFVLFASVPFAQQLELVENKGQWNNKVQFEGKLTSGAFFLEPHGYKIVQQHPGDLQYLREAFHGGTGSQLISTQPEGGAVLRSHAYEVLFDHCNPSPQIIPESPAPGYNNYFIGNDPGRWASDCKIYGTATYKEMYPGIDVRYYSDNGHLKYDIIINPDADISNLALNYEGVDSLGLKGGDLFVYTSVGSVKERSPYSYQVVNGIRTPVDCRFIVSGKTLKYEIGNYNRHAALIIDPELVFSTFTGSTADNWGYNATYGPGGVMFGASIVFATGFPVSNGAYQTSFGSGTNTGEGAPFDIGILKLSSDGSQRMYATYIGGNGNELPQSLVADVQGNLVVAGRTTSPNFPVTRPLIGTGGGWDIIVFKLNAAGTALSGSVRIGGSANDGVNIRNKYPNPQPQSLLLNYNDDSRSEVLLDAAGNILLASCAQSTNFPVTTATAFQPVKAGPAFGTGNQDGLFLKFDPALSNLTYGSFLGGSGDDAAYVMSISPQTGDIWIGGGTASSDFPGNKTGTLGVSAAGSIDGFLAVVSPAGALLRSTYIGTNANEQIYGLTMDRNGFPYITGTTTGNFPVQNAAFSQAGSKQFIAKLQKNLGSYVYATVFGTNAAVPNISPTAFYVDNCENVYVSGWGGSITQSGLPQFPNAGTAGLTVTPDAIQSTTDGRDLYLFVLKKNAASHLYGSFFGQNGGATDHLDGGSCKFDENGVLYQAVCANCGGNVTFPTTPGSWSTQNSSNGLCNQALLKIRFNFTGVRAGIKSSIGLRDGDTSSCLVPLTVNFRDTVAVGASYEWNFGDGTPVVTTTIPNTSHSFASAGLYRTRLISIDNLKCIPRDTSYINIKSSTSPNLGADTTVYQDCYGDLSNLLSLYNTTGTTASWNTATPAAVSPGIYRLIASNTEGCADTAIAVVVLEVATWTGTSSSNWHIAANWNINKVPGAKTQVIVPGGTVNECIISAADAQAASIQLINGATVRNLNNHRLEIKGNCAILPPH